MREYVFQSNNITICKFRDEKEVAKSLWCSIYVRFPSISKEAFKDLLKLKLQPTRIFNGY